MDFIDEGKLLVGERAQLIFARRFPAFRGEAGGLVIGIADEADTFSSNPFADLEGAGSDGVEAEQVMRAVVMVFAVVIFDGFASDGRGEVHREPVKDLRVRAVEVEEEFVIVDELYGGEGGVVVEGTGLFCGVRSGLESGEVIGEGGESGRLHGGIGDALERVAHVGGEDGTSLSVGFEAGVGMEADTLFQNAPVCDFSVWAAFPPGQGFEEAGLEFVGIGFEGVILQEAFLDGFEDAATDLVVGDLRVEGARVFGGGSVADEPGGAVIPLRFEGRNVWVVRATDEEGGERCEESDGEREAAHGTDMKAKRS